MGLISWFVKPAVEIAEQMRQVVVTIQEKRKQHVLEKFDEPIVNNFRPETFDQYIGQDKAKEILKSYIEAIKQRQKPFPHLLIHGKAGCGKTTLAKIVANELGIGFQETIATEIKDSIDVEMRIEESNGGIVFIDEIHSLDRDTCEGMYTIMEDFKLEGEPIKPFTLVGATTELGEILKNRRPFYDRFKIIIELENYTSDNLVIIAKQYKDKVFPIDRVNDEVYNIIGKNSRGTPRTAIRYLEATIYLNNDINRVLKNFNIIKDGYTNKDLKVLKYLETNIKGVGLQGLSSYLGTSTENYCQEIEPFLLEQGLILRTPRGRKISPDGSNKIKELETK